MAKAKAKRKVAANGKTTPRKPAARKKSSALSAAAKRALLKPRSGATDLAFAIATTWKTERGMRVDGLSAARLQSIARKARRSDERVTKLEEKHARQMQPVQDANLIADDALWRALLDLRASIALRARKDPTVEKRFSALIDALKNRATAPASARTAVPAPPPKT